MTIKSNLQRWLLAFAVCLLIFLPAAAVSPFSIQTTQPEHYLIISADLFVDHLDEFIALKQSQGFTVTLDRTSEIGQTKDEIKSHIISHYQSSSPPNYLLLVGDNNFIPVWPALYDNSETDLYYTTMDGVSDFTPDIKYGRLPVRNTIGLDNWVAKILSYEQASGGEPWAKGASFLATNNQTLVDHKTAAEIAEEVHNFVINGYTKPAGFMGSYPNNPEPGGDQLFAMTYGAGHDETVSALNSGRQIVTYFGLGSSSAWLGPEFNKDDVRSMTGPPIPLVIGFASDTADFSVTESLADTWITQAGGGALAYIGAATSTTWIGDHVLEEEFFKKLFSTPSNPPSLGMALQYGLARLKLYSPFIGATASEAYQLFGDPSLRILIQPKTVDFSLAGMPAHFGICTEGQGVTTIRVEGKYGFDQPINLSISELPVGWRVSFNPNPILPGVDSTLTLTAIGAVPGDYPLTVLGESGGLVRPSELVFSIHNAPPAGITLLEPAAFTPNSSLRPEFTWSNSEGSLWYDIEVASDHLFNNIVLSITGLAEPRFTPDAELLPEMTYWWRVRATNACGFSAYSLPGRFTARAELGQCSDNATRETIYHTDFEAGTIGWSTAGAPPIWALVSTSSHTPSRSFFGDSQLMSVSDQRLVSPAIQLPGVDQSPIELFFWSMHAFEYFNECKDGGLLEISTDGGARWNQIAEENLLILPYDGLVSSGHLNPLGNQRAWCGARDWSQAAVRLDDYHNQSVRLRWRLGTDGSTAEGVGWYIDDVSVESCQYPPSPGVSIDPVESLIIGLSGEVLVHSLQLTNTGPQPANLELSVSGNRWETQINPTSLMLDAGQSAPVTVSVRIPPEANPDDGDRTPLIALVAEDQAVHAAAELETRVSLYRLSLGAAQPLLNGKPGDAVTFTVQLTNQGTVADTVSLTLIPPENWVIAPLESQLTLAPGESRQILATVFIPENAAVGSQAELSLQAQSQGNTAVQTSLSLGVIVSPHTIFLPFLYR